MPEESKTPFYLGLAVGGLPAVYEGYRLFDIRGHLSKIKVNCETLIGSIDQYQSGYAELSGLIGQYIAGYHELVAKLNTAMASGVPVDEAELTSEEQAMAELEHQIAAVQYAIDVNILGAQEAASMDPLRWLWAALRAIGVAVLVYIGVRVGFATALVIKKFFDRWHDTHLPPPTATCPVCHIVIHGATVDEVRHNMEAHLMNYHPVNVDALLTVVPEAQSKFAELPEWVQKSIAVESGIQGFFYQPDWTQQFRSNPWYLYAIVAVCAVAAVVLVVTDPALAPALAAVLARFGLALA